MAVHMAQRTERVVGLMSGTSCDGVSAALMEVQWRGAGLRLRPLAACTVSYPRATRRALLDIGHGAAVPAGTLARLHYAVGAFFAGAARRVCRAAGVSLASVRAIGSHGHTVFHGPDAGVTYQIGEAAVIADRTGITTVADFRPADVAAGGQGAPLVPFIHYLLFRHPRRARAIQNLGGIGNVTYVPPAARLCDVVAFDTGPGNMVIDGEVRMLTGSRAWFDRDGRLARAGHVSAPLLRHLLRHPYLRRPPPKTAGRELFGDRFVERVVRAARRHRLSDADVVATVTALTARSVTDAYRRFLGRIDDVIVCGGGARNPVLVGMLAAELPDTHVCRSGELGYAEEALEAYAFGILASAAVHGRAANVPAATGARRSVVLGKIVPGGNYLGVRLPRLTAKIHPR
jgi:anhydro-N-acetylmuramic acid kinase